MSTLSDRWRNTSSVFRVLLLVLLVTLLLLSGPFSTQRSSH
jgi:hypothetical protein